jgi:DNA-binding transcriptional regulator YhcF (GntR family)
MNTANETLRSIRQQKTIITKKHEKAVERCRDDEKTLKMLDDKFIEDMKLLDNEEKELLTQLKVKL